MTAFSDETGELLAETKRIIACGVTDFPVYQAIALLEKFEAALSASPVETWKCAARKQSLPEPADCGWPTCGCDPYADKVIAALEEQGHAAPVAQEPVAHQYRVCIAGKWSDWIDLQHSVDKFRSGDWKFNLENGTCELRALYAGTPPATPAGVGADEIARVIDDAINKYGSLMFIQEHGWSGFCAKVREHALALLSRAGDQK